MDDEKSDQQPGIFRSGFWAGAAVILAAIMSIFVLYLVTGSDDEDRATENDMEVADEIDIAELPPEFEAIEPLEPRAKVEPLEMEAAPDEGTRLDEDPFDNFRSAYRQHYEENQQHLIHVTLDRPMYRPGQSIRWRSWHLSPGDFGPGGSDGDEVEFELVDPRGSVVHEETIEKERGMTAGTFEIDDVVPGGSWTLRIDDGEREYERPVLISQFEPPRFRQQVDFSQLAYRPGEEVTAQVEIRRDTGDVPIGMLVEGYVQVAGSHVVDVSDTLDGRGEVEFTFILPPTIEEDDAALVLTIEEGGMVETETWPIALSLESVEIEFFPEGGELVEGLESRVYFEASDLSGEPVEVKARLINDRGDSIEELETSHRGRGSFDVTPDDVRSYRMVIDSPEVDQTFEMPAAKSEGCVLRLYDDFDSQAEAVRVGVWCTENKTIGIMGAMGSELFDVARMVAGPKDPAIAYLRPEDGEWPRPAGTVRVTVIEDDSDISILAERVTFRGRRAQLGIVLDFDRDVYHPGQTVNFEITTSGLDGEPLKADLVKAAVDDRVHARASHQDVPTIVARLLLAADDLHFWGEAEEANEYFDLYEDSAAGLDLLVATRGWRSSDKLDNYYVDGGTAQIPKPPPIRRPQPRPRTARVMPESDEMDGRMLGIGALESSATGGAARSGSPQQTAPPSPAPEPSPAEIDVQEAPAADDADDADDSELARGVEPRFLRDDDAVAFALWETELSTNADGQLNYSFDLPEAIGAYRIALEGLSETGLVGRTEHVVPVEVPLSVVTRLPEILSGKDRVDVPVTVRNGTEEPIIASVELEADGPVSIHDGAATFEIEIPARSSATSYVPVTIDDARGAVTIRAFAEGGGFSDGAAREVTIEPRGFRRTWHVSGELPGTERQQAPLMGMTDAGAEANIVLYASPVAEALEGVDSMARRPTGCFEQTSSRNHPNLLVWQHLKEADQLDESIRRQLLDHTESAYSRMSGYEVNRAGFEWFGRGSGQAYLTAWGLVQFSMMKEMIDDFDDALIDRSVAFLRSLRSDGGGWDGGTDDNWQRITGDRRRSAELFTLYGLARSGHLDGFSAQLANAEEIGRNSDSAYEVALVTAIFAFAGDRESTVNELVERLIGLQNSDGSWTPTKGRSWAGGYGGALNIETTGLAALALIRTGGHRLSVTKAVEWLDNQKSGHGWWGSTQATVMALEARIAFEREGMADVDGPVTVLVNGEEVGQVHMSTTSQKPVRLDGFGEVLTAKATQIQIRSQVPVSYDLEVTWRLEEFETKGDGPLAFEVGVDAGDNASMGDEVSLQVNLTNLEEDALGMVVARIALPAGLEVSPRELDALVERTDVDFYETTGRHIVLYFDDLGGDEEQQIRFSAVAAVPGKFELPASVAYAYYRDESQWKWSERSQFVVDIPR